VLQRVDHPNGIVTYRSPLLAQTHVPHAFSTRLGGVSPPPFDTLNLAQPTAAAPTELCDSQERIRHNYEQLLAAVGCDGRTWASVDQVHGRDVVHVGATNTEEHASADAMVTTDRRVVLSVRTADCVPVLIATCEGEVVGAAHAGWRGIAKGVVQATVAAMRGRHGADPADLIAAVGPCIGPDHYEVGTEVVDAFEGAGLGMAVISKPTGGVHISLAVAVAAQLASAGLAEAAIDRSDCCTFRDGELFYSHRRDAGVTGRMAAVIGVRG